MRFLMVLTLLIAVIACGRKNQVYQPGDSFTADDVNRDRSQTKIPLERVDETETNSVPRSEEITIPIPREEISKGKKPHQPPKIELLLNQMKVSESQISVGEHSGLIEFTAKAVIDGKEFPVALEGRVRKDSTADLLTTNGTDENFRAQVFCNGDVKEGTFGCDSLFVDLYFKVNDSKFYREQLQLVSEEKKKSDLQNSDESNVKADSKTKKPDDDDESEDIPDAKGTYVGQPERLPELYSEKTDSPISAPSPSQQAKKPTELPVGKKEKPKPAQASKPSPQPPPPKTAAPPSKPAPPPPAQPTKHVTTAAPVPTRAPAPAPTQAPAAKQQPKPKQQVEQSPPESQDDEPVPAKVVLDVNDDPSRPTDQAIGGYGGGGKLENASSLPFEGENYYFSQPQEQHNYGTYDLVRVIKIFAAKVFNEIMPGVKLRITDMSAKHGGHLPPHKGHQNGLEVDIGYLTSHAHDRVSQPVMSGGSWLGTMAMKQMWLALKFLGGSSRVSRVFVNPGVKPHICSFARAQSELQSSGTGRLTLQKIMQVEGHSSHFHVRLECGRYNPRCRTDGPPPQSTGC